MKAAAGSKNGLTGDVSLFAHELQRICGVDLMKVCGLNLLSVLMLIAEIGVDMSRWPNAKAFCSWLGLCPGTRDRKSTRLNSSHSQISYAVFCLKKKKYKNTCI